MSNNQNLSSEMMRRWHQIFRVLSLDCATPLWKQMGLDLCENDKMLVKYAARIAYLIVQDGSKNYYHADYSKVQVGKKVFSICISKYRSGKFAKEILSWCRSGFIVVEKLDISVEKAWSLAFVRIKREHSFGQLLLDLSEQKIKWFIDKIEPVYLKINVLDDFLSKNTSGSKTDWDQFIYETSLAPAGDETEECQKEALFDALLDASNTIQENDINKLVIHIWRDIINEFSKEEIDKLFECYRNLMKDVSTIFPHILAIPSIKTKDVRP